MVAQKDHKPDKVAQLSVESDNMEVTEANAMINAQRADPYYARIIDFLEKGHLPEDDFLARQVILTSDYFFLDNSTLYRSTLSQFAKNNS